MAITAKKLKAVELLSDGYSQREVAAALSVVRSTLQKWLNNPVFADLVATRETERLEEVRGRLRRQRVKALDLVEAALAGQKVTTAQKGILLEVLKAASVIVPPDPTAHIIDREVIIELGTPNPTPLDAIAKEDEEDAE